MGSFNPYSISSWLTSVFPPLRKTQTTNFSLAIFGMVKKQSSNMSEIVRAWSGTMSHRHRWKRLQRFFSNPLIKPEQLMALWVKWCMKTFTAGSEYVYIAIDWSTLKRGHQCILIALVLHGRGVPLMWQIVPSWDDIKDSQNRIEQRLLAKLLNLIPKDKCPIIIGDRGFGYTDLIKFLMRKEALFVLRVKADVMITPHKGRKRKLRNFQLTPGEQLWFPNIKYRQQNPVCGVNLATTIAQDSEDSWLLITNLDDVAATITCYELRFQIEEWFKDLKHMIRIADMRTKNMKRIRRIIFTACIADGLLMVIGKLTDTHNDWKDHLITGRNRSASLIWFAIKIIQEKLGNQSFWGLVWKTARCGP